MRERPTETPAKIRGRLAAGGLGPEAVETVVAKLSGGQKARLSMLLATLEAPHLIILDEPTNHLDIQSREALVQALTAYNGAVILVSHDSSLVELVADRLWLVKDGSVKPYTEDMDAYRRMLLSERGGSAKDVVKKDKPAKPVKQPPRAKPNARLKAEVATCEARVNKLEEMRDNIDRRLGNKALYERGDIEEIDKWTKKRKEVMKGLERAESMWMNALEQLEKSKR